jgi:hypothetical protein
MHTVTESWGTPDAIGRANLVGTGIVTTLEVSVLPALIHRSSMHDERPRVVFHRTSLLLIAFTMHHQIQSG